MEIEEPKQSNEVNNEDSESDEIEEEVQVLSYQQVVIGLKQLKDLLRPKNLNYEKVSSY